MRTAVMLLLLMLLAAASAAAAQQPSSPAPSAGGGGGACAGPPPRNISQEATQVLRGFCAATAQLAASSAGRGDIATNLTAAKEARAAYDRLLASLPSDAPLWAPSAAAARFNDTLGNVSVVIAAPRSGAASARAGPARGGEGPLIVHLHGGGYVYGTCDRTLRTVALVAAAAGARALCVEYRLAPEHPFPAALDDALAVYTALVRERGFAPASSLALVGDSAGGGLAMAVLQALKARGLAPQPAAAGLMSPWLNLAGKSDTYETLLAVDPVYGIVAATPPEAYVTGLRGGGGDGSSGGGSGSGKTATTQLSDPLVSPVFGAYDASFAPVLIQAGLREVLLGDAVQLFRRLRDAGACAFISPWNGMWHDFMAFGGMPEADAAQREMGDFVASRFYYTNRGGNGGGSGSSGGKGCFWPAAAAAA